MLPRILRDIPPTVVLLDAAVAALSATLLPQRLIPENLDVIGPIASLLVLVGLLLTPAYRDAFRARTRALAGLAGGSVVVLLVLQLGFVVPVAPYGADAGIHRFLVGFHYTPLGEQWTGQLGPMSTPEYISAIGDDRIPAMWGSSYLATAMAYSLSYMTLVVSVVLLLGGSTLARAPASRPGVDTSPPAG